MGRPGSSSAFSLIVASVGRTESLARLLASLPPPNDIRFEVIVADQNGTDQLHQIIEPFLDRIELRRTHVPPSGANRARNAGARLAKYDWLAFPDDDCEFFPDTLTVAARLAALDGVAAFSGVFLDPAWKSPKLRRSFVDRQRHGRWLVPSVNESTLFIKREVFLALGGFDPQFGPGAAFPSAEGSDLVIRMIRDDPTTRWIYAPELRVQHPLKGPPWDEAAAARMQRIGYGAGALVAKYPRPSYLIEYVVHVSKAAFAGITLYRGWKQRAFLNWSTSFVRGFVDYRRGAAQPMDRCHEEDHTASR